MSNCNLTLILNPNVELQPNPYTLKLWRKQKPGGIVAGELVRSQIASFLRWQLFDIAFGLANRGPCGNQLKRILAHGMTTFLKILEGMRNEIWIGTYLRRWMKLIPSNLWSWYLQTYLRRWMKLIPSNLWRVSLLDLWIHYDHSLQVVPVEASHSMDISPKKVAWAKDLLVSWSISNDQASKMDWIGVYPKGGTNDQYLDYR